MSLIEIEIDGKKMQVAQGAMVIEVADIAGIHIPRFCYHKKLSIAANCRMCLVEVEKVPKPLPACATPVTAGMKIFTQSAKALDAQRSVMEFLLINHPLDCPICDQGGACELQDISMGYGKDISRYTESKRVVKDEDLGSLVATDMTRCIQCTRCVRFGQEIAGIRELGTLHRGDRTEIGTYLKQQALNSELSGNVIDLCPVGALTSKPFRFTARAWELTQFPSIAPHDGVGSNIYLQTRRQQIMRVVPRENEQINETWISDRDRFSYQALYAEDRLLKPLIKQQGKWIEADWTTALTLVAKRLQAVQAQYGGKEIATLMSASATLEEYYLLQKIARGLESPHIDYRVRYTDVDDQFDMPFFPSLNMPIEQIQNQEVIILIGSHINHAQPLLAHRVRKAFLQGAKIIAINAIDYPFAFDLADKRIVSPSQWGNVLTQILKENLFADILSAQKNKLILLGELAFSHPKASQLRALTQAIADKYQATIGYLTEGANSAGAWITGAVPHRGVAGENLLLAGYSAFQALKAKLRAYILFGIEPLLDCANPLIAKEALMQAECVIAFSTYRSAELLDYADILLPMAPFAETSGTFVNISGEWQSFQMITSPQAESKPAWKILRVLGNLLHLPQFDYQTSEQIRDEVAKLVAQRSGRSTLRCEMPLANVVESSSSLELERIAEWPLYRGDMLVRRSSALQNCAANEPLDARIHPLTAAQHQLSDNGLVKIRQHEQEIILPVKFDQQVALNCVVVPAGFAETAVFSHLFGALSIEGFNA